MVTFTNLPAQSAEVLRYFSELLHTLDEGDLLLADIYSSSGKQITGELSPDETVRELKNACEKIAFRQRLSRLRIEIRKAAARDRVSEEKLIKMLLTMAGPALKLSRCTYFSLLPATGDGQCTIQWTAPGVPSVINATLPGSLIREYFGEKSVQIHEGETTEKNQAEIAALLRRYRVKSILALFYDNPAAPRGILTFSSADSYRRWTPFEIGLLSEIVQIISQRAERQRAEDALVESGERLEREVRNRTAELSEANRLLTEKLAGRQSLPGACDREKGLLAATLRSLPEAVVTTDENGRILFFNAAAETLTGWKADEAVGKEAREVLALSDVGDRSRQSDEFIDQCLAATERKEDRRYLLSARDGTERIAECQCAIFQDDAGGGVVITLRDITKSYTLEGEFLKHKRLESVGMLAAGIAHDFNNLLTGITTYLFMARMSSVANVETCAIIAEAEKAALKASTLTKQLLSFAKGAATIQETVSIKQLILDTVGFSLSGSNVDYQLDLPDNLFPVDVDRGQIDQVLTNLLNNAAQAMPGGGTVTIAGANFVNESSGFPYGSASLSGSAGPDSRARQVQDSRLPLPAGHYVKISVRDEGAGIPIDHLERIFDPYFTTKKTCTGLGLTVVYSIIKRHNGHIEVKSEPGKGSTFAFYLPASAHSTGKRTAESPMTDHPAGKILVMDDDTVVRTVVETLLRKSGYTPVSVSNGREAIEQYAKAVTLGQPFVAAILDLTIPGGMGAKETVIEIREIDPAAKVIAFSGYSNDPILRNFRRSGFDGVLAKPFSIEEFLATLQGVLKPPSKGISGDTASRHGDRS